MTTRRKPRNFEHSFASQPHAVDWNHELNPMGPECYTKCCDYNAWFNCPNPICKHVFQLPLNSVKAGKWCPYCANRQICRCAICFPKSFASTENSKYLDPKCGDPRDHFKHSDYEGTFNCPCGHQFESKLDNVTKGKWCPYCGHTIVCKDHDNCKMCFENSFASVEKCWGWLPKNPGVPRDYLKSSHKKFLFNCKPDHTGHEFSARLFSVTDNNWCPFCKNKTEGKLSEWFKTTSFTVKPQASFEWSLNPESKRRLQFDFCIMALMVLCELDGSYHFVQVSNWRSPHDAVIRDVWKTQRAMENGFTIIRVNQEDVLGDKGNWQQKLLSQIFAREKPTILYLSTDDCYVKHKDMLQKLIHFENMMAKHLKPKWVEYLKDFFIDTKIEHIAKHSKRLVLRESARALLLEN